MCEFGKKKKWKTEGRVFRVLRAEGQVLPEYKSKTSNYATAVLTYTVS